ncbi:MAG: crossover junction endodeoxyribonuclease RuvC [Deltaproteobacteria bacterium]|nr:crossover junction endodeoxyribonuclease RuvC [Deltaproteobacteria bacterium]
MTVLGVDPGSRATGYGLVAADGDRLRHVDSGFIAVPQRLPHSQRLAKIFQSLEGLIRVYDPTVLVVEAVFLANNVQSTIKLGQVRGVVLLAAGLANLPVFEYSPLVLKKAIVGYGQASKTQMLLMVEQLLGLKINNHNTADALALSLCHHFYSRWSRQVDAPQAI